MRTLSRRFLLSATGASLAGGLARAADIPPTPPPAPPVIGAALPLSGDLSLLGIECLRGIQLAAGTANLITADTISQPQTAAAANSLITAHAALLLGSGDSDLSYPATAAAELAQIPFIELNAPADGLTTRGFKFLLRTGPTTSMIAALAVATVLRRYPGRQIGILFNTGATGGAIAAAALAGFTAAKAPVALVIGTPVDAMDLHDPVGRFQRAGVEVVLHAGGPSDVLAFYQAMQQQSWQPQAVLGCGPGYALRANALALGAAFDGTLVIAAPFYPPSAAALKAAYTARFGLPPQSPDSLTAYTGAKLVFDTLAAQGNDPTKLLAALRGTNIAQGALPNGYGIAFDRSGQNTRSFVTLQQWRDQTLLPVT